MVKNGEQTGGAGIHASATAIDRYIEAQPAAVQSRLYRVRQIIREELPEAEERIAYAMPSWWQASYRLHMAAHRNHIGLYPGAAGVAAFAARLVERGIPFSKGAIQLRHGEALPEDLIRAIARFCAGSA